MKLLNYKKKYVSLIILLIFFSTVCIFSQETDTENDRKYIDIDPGFTLWGARLLVSYNIFDLLVPDTYTAFEAGFGGSYEDMHYFRYPDNTLYTPPGDDSETDISLYKRTNFRWLLGMKQGFLFNPRIDKNFIELQLSYKGNYEKYLYDESPTDSLIFQSMEENDITVLQNSLIFGLLLNNLSIHDKYYSVNGYSAHLLYEFAPGFLGNNIYSESDFNRLQLSGIGALELLKNKNISIYVADRIIMDFLFGNEIPINMQTTIGSSNLDTTQSLGDSVRGIEDSRFDGNIKLVNNFDIRVLFPSIFNYYVIPGLIFFFDTGVSDEEYNKIDLNNLKWTCGTGLYLQFDIAGRAVGCLLRFHYFINEQKFSGNFGIGFDFIDY